MIDMDSLRNIPLRLVVSEQQCYNVWPGVRMACMGWVPKLALETEDKDRHLYGDILLQHRVHKISKVRLLSSSLDQIQSHVSSDRILEALCHLD